MLLYYKVKCAAEAYLCYSKRYLIKMSIFSLFLFILIPLELFSCIVHSFDNLNNHIFGKIKSKVSRMWIFGVGTPECEVIFFSSDRESY